MQLYLALSYNIPGLTEIKVEWLGLRGSEKELVKETSLTLTVPRDASLIKLNYGNPAGQIQWKTICTNKPPPDVGHTQTQHTYQLETETHRHIKGDTLDYSTTHDLSVTSSQATTLTLAWPLPRIIRPQTPKCPQTQLGAILLAVDTTHLVMLSGPLPSPPP